MAPRVKKALRLGGIVVLALVVGALSSFFLLTRTRVGQGLVLANVLQRIEGSVNGEIVVSGIHSTGLHKGATLLGVSVRAPDGSPLLAADSLHAEYSVRGILAGNVVLSKVTLWQPVFTITKSEAERPFNLSQFLAGPERSPGDESRAQGEPDDSRRLVLEDVTIRGGRVEVRYPLASPPGPESRIVTVPGPDGQGVFRVLDFSGIDARLHRITIIDPDVDGLRADVDGLTLEGEVFDDPVRVEQFVGRIEYRDRRVLVTAERLELPGTEASGLATVDLSRGGPPELTLDFVASRLDLLDLRWLQPGLPDAQGSGGIGVNLGPDGLRVRWSGLRLSVGGGEVTGSGVYSRLRGRAAFLEDVSLDVAGVPVPALAGYLPWTPPLEGMVYGYVGLSGGLDALAITGRVALLEPGVGPTGGEIEGILHLRPPFGATDLQVRLTPFDLSLVNRVAEGLRLEGALSLDLQAGGRLDDGIEVTVNASYPDPETVESHLTLAGSLIEVDGRVEVSLGGELEPLSIAGLFGDDSPLSRLGVARGTVRADGPLSAVVLRADLATGGGELTLESRFDARSPLASYQLLGRARDFDAREVFPELPEGTILSGSMDLRGEGGDLRTAELSGQLHLTPSRLAHMDVDTVAVQFRISGGVLTVDTIQGVVGGVSVEGAGELAMSQEAPPGELLVRFETDDLLGVRPLFMGPDVITRDGLTPLDRGILEMRGVDPDALPSEAEVAMSGRMVGDLTLGGSLESLTISGQADFEEAVYRRNRVGRAAITFSATGLLSEGRQVDAQIDADGIRILERAFDSASVRIEYQGSRGRLNLFLVRSEEESYSARVAFEQDSTVRTVHLDELVLRFPDERWNLGGPATIAWDPDGLTFRDLRLIRPGVGGMRLQAQGRLPFEGEADFRLDVQRLDVSRIAHLLQLNERLEGLVDVALTVTGDDSNPVMTGTVSTVDFRFRDYDFDRLEAELDYADRRATGDVELWRDSIQVLTVSGALPLDLAFDPGVKRIPDEAIDLMVVSDQMPIALLMAPLDSYQDVGGTITGRVQLGGTMNRLAPDGQLTVSDGEAFLTGLGVRYRDVNGTLDWFPDGRVEIDANVRARGRASIKGTVTLAPVSDPGLDLTIDLRRFQGMDRRDVTGRLSGHLLLSGTYRKPVVSGELSVDEGTLFVEEFQRAASIVSLADTAFFQLVDTTLVDRSILGGQNPFLRNIRMENTTLTVSRDSWIRSDKMNVELDGQLQVLYDRSKQDLVLIGTLQSVRGSYDALGRQFQVDGGTLRFLGTPGINPDLNIQASRRVRSAQGDRFTINAAVNGTLVSPRVALTSDQPGLTENDLVSYLYFGRPSYGITSGQSRALGAAGTLLGSGVTLGLSTFSNRLGSAVAQELGFVDYLSITQQDLGALGDASLSGTFETTVVESGFYVADDFFVTLLLRPLSSQGAGSQFAGIRFEWVASNAYTIESFFEDRFFRGRVLGFGELGIQNEKGFGLYIFREWGY